MSDQIANRSLQEIIDNAPDFVLDAPGSKPEIQVDLINPDQTVDAVAAAFRASGKVFDRGIPVVIATDRITNSRVAHPLTPSSAIRLTHQIARPKRTSSKNGIEVSQDAALPKSITTMYLESRTIWDLPALQGFSSAPILDATGTIRSAVGYDAATGLWLEDVPDVAHLVPDRPTTEQARIAFQELRKHLRTMCFADAAMTRVDGIETDVVDLSRSPGEDESAALIAMMTAVARPSLDRAPGVLIRAASISGAGTGKGQLARSLSQLAFGQSPSAVTMGDTAQEFEKRLSAELIAGSPTLFLDNINGIALKSNLLASAITESPARVRRLGRSEMLPLNSRALIVVTGNGVTVTEDLARRFITIELDARMDSPETRAFPSELALLSLQNRNELLKAVLTIWRWGLQSQDIVCGVPSGSFGQWARWCRDPMLALGCKDPIARQAVFKNADPHREHVAAIFDEWNARHGDTPVKANDLHPAVKALVHPGKVSRQQIVGALTALVGTRLAGRKLVSLIKTGRWPGRKYQLQSSE